MTKLSTAFSFNGDTIKVSFDFHGDSVHIEVSSKALGTIEESSASAAGYIHIKTADDLVIYAMQQLAFHAYALAETIEELENE